MARVEGRAYCLMCALLIPTTNTEREEGARDTKPEVCFSQIGDLNQIQIQII